VTCSRPHVTRKFLAPTSLQYPQLDMHYSWVLLIVCAQKVVSDQQLTYPMPG